MDDCQMIRMKKSRELSTLIGKWINAGRWDGSYIVLHQDQTIGYWFPSKFEYTGLTIGEARQLRDIRKEQKERREKKKLDQKEMEQPR